MTGFDYHGDAFTASSENSVFKITELFCNFKYCSALTKNFKMFFQVKLYFYLEIKMFCSCGNVKISTDLSKNKRKFQEFISEIVYN